MRRGRCRTRDRIGQSPAARAWRAALALLAACCLPWADSARAQPADEPPEYRELVRQALSEFDRGNWHEAYAGFKRAHDAFPNARTQRSLGIAAFEARRYVLALEHLQAALDDGRRPLTAEQRAEAASFMERAAGYVARLSLAITPSTATVQVDGGTAVTPPPSGELLLDPGNHELRLAAPGYAGETMRVAVNAGERRALQVALRPSAAERAGATAADPAGGAPAAAEDGEPSMLGPYVVLGTGGALLIAAAITGLLAQSAHGELEDECVQGVCDPSLESTKQRGQSLQVATNVLLAVGAAAIAGGGAWWLVQNSEASGGESDGVALACGVDGCKASYRRRF